MISVEKFFSSQIFECFCNGVQDSLHSMCGEKPVSLGDQARHEEPFEGIAGTICYVGDKSLSMMLGLPKKTAVWIAEKFAGFEIEYRSSDMGDMVGEVTNVIAGDISARLADADFPNQISIPTATRGRDVEMLLMKGKEYVSFDFTLSCGPFWVKLTFSEEDSL